MTTRQPRIEEGDKGRSNLEYEFLSREEFAGRLARGNVANFIEWNGSFYGTDIDMLIDASKLDTDCLLYEDMPSAISLKRYLGSKASIILLFTEDKNELLKLEFAALTTSRRASVWEWRRRLGEKYIDGTRQKGEDPNDATKRSTLIGRCRELSQILHS
jgi:guanylate kinase